MPARLLLGYTRNMASIQAGEHVRLLNVLTAALGRLEPEAQREYLRALELAANHGTTPRRPVQRFASPEAAMAHMASLGVAVPS